MGTAGYALDSTWRTLLKDLDISPANVLRRAGLPDDLLHQPSVRLASADYYRLWYGIEAELDDSPLPLPLPLRLCYAIRSESFSPALFASLCSPNLLVAAQRIARYKTLIGPMRLEVTQADGRVSIEFSWLDDALLPPLSLVVMELLFCVTLARMGTREEIRPLGVTTHVLPSHRALYESFLGARIERGTTHRVTFSTADATRPFLTSNEAMWNAFEPEFRERLASLDTTATTTQRVRAALLEELPSGLVTIDAIARKLAVSKRTLQRRVHAEGGNFQQILNETREKLARHYLKKTTMPAAEISFLLGFDEANSFYRAFKTWTGATPDQVRRG
ncbi:AraC family transcriptional regulator (plasmid) [Rahnella sikkimica]|uniref:AraC family transcriptional regulator n=2 Tax=Rahnella sikkimica TaxID=1805933 RepID=A0A2L1UYZ4_9GAMM|nr:AraC family transcriptional regulator [Rahnella sikkimica]AVF38166.1 AraC family transcriptional regulator [Rahnella sikkimica]